MTERSGLLLLALVLAIALGVPGCGGEEDGGSGANAALQDRPTGPVGEYEEVLLDLRDAAAAGEIYDAYGFAEYMPRAQRAAIDAFCFIVERLLDRGEVEQFADLEHVNRQVEAQARIEFDHGAPGDISSAEMASARRAIRKLRTIVDYAAIDEELAAGYVRACYNRME